MNGKQRAEAALKHDKIDRIPLFLFLGGSWQIANSGFTYRQLLKDPERSGEVFAASTEEFDADIAAAGTGATALFMKALGGRVEYGKQGFPVILSEPLDSKEKLKDLSPEMVLADPDVRSLIESAAYQSAHFNGSRLLLGNGRGPFTLAGQMFGIENFSRALYKDTEFVHALLEFTTEVALLYFRAMIQEGKADGIMICDPTASGDVISKKHFKRFALPSLEKIIAEAKAMSKPVFVHICGNIEDRLADLADAGIDCLSIDTKVSLPNVKRTVGDRLCIAGNADPVGILKFGGKTDVQQEAERCITTGGTRGFVLMPGCDLSPDVPYNNIQAFANAVHIS